MEVWGQLKGVGPLLPYVSSGIEPRSSGVATGAFAALLSHQPITVIFHSHCTEENTKAKKWTGEVMGFRSGDRVARA